LTFFIIYAIYDFQVIRKSRKISGNEDLILN
jgi:hypothetical protein